MEISFAVWAPSRDIFWQSWIDAGICQRDERGNIVFRPHYQGIEVSDSWSGVITKYGTETTPDGLPIPRLLPGWHTNVYVRGPLVEAFTAGLPQMDEQGKLLSIWDRTWAAQPFQLQERPRDDVTGFPAGYRNSAGVCYADLADIATSANVRQ